MGFEEEARAYHKKGNNCSKAVYAAYAERLGIDLKDALREAPSPRGEGGQCGAYLAGKKVLEKLKPEAVPEFEKKFIDTYGHTECIKLITLHGFKKNCNDYVGNAAKWAEELSQECR